MRVTDHMHAHLDDDVAPERLAELAAMSLHHFHRVFRGMTGESVMGFVRRLRLERAAQQLKFGNQSVTDVAFASGYGSHEGFTRAFRARFGACPRTYREHTRWSGERDCAIELRNEPQRVCIAYRHVGCYTRLVDAWAALLQLRIGDASLTSLGLCYDDPDVTAANQLRYDACLVMAADAMPAVLPASCAPRIVAAGRYAVALHIGPYEELTETYLALLGRWLPHRGLELSDEPIVEIYVDDPQTTPPAQRRTEICVRIH